MHNPDKLGYSYDQLEGDSYFNLFPYELRNYLIATLSKSLNYFYLHELFITSHRLYILSHNNYLQPVTTKLRIANTELNDICAVVAFMSDKEGMEIALLSDDGKRIVHIVISI